MIDFHNINLPQDIENFAIKNIKFSNICLSAKSGKEVRGAFHSCPRHEYLLQNCYLSKNQFEVFSSFFYARCGRRYAFLLKDYNDFSCKRELIAIGDEKNKELYLTKTYSDPISPYSRRIIQPIENSISFYILDNNMEKKTVVGQFNYDKGVILLNESILKNQKLFADFEFNIPVRFAEDSFNYSFNVDGTILLDNVRLVEII